MNPPTDSVASEENDTDRLRELHYNATIIERLDVHSDLARFRIRPDEPFAPFEPGQYVALGLGLWEPRLEGTQAEEVPEKRRTKIGRRAYSISCPMIDVDGNLLTCQQVDYLEFYITLVRQASTPDGKPPLLTPRLFLKQPGERLVVEHRIVGHYTLGNVNSHETVLFLATGTGEAPHNAMVASLLQRGHQGKIINATSVRFLNDLAYAREHARLSELYPNYIYVPLTTREPKNLDPTRPDFVGKQYLQNFYTSGKLSDVANDSLDPANTHVFLCGNPAMIGYVPPGAETPAEPGMLQVLTRAGFQDHHGEHMTPGVGCIRFEKYW